MQSKTWTEAEIHGWVPQILADAGLDLASEIEKMRGGLGCVFRVGTEYTVRFGLGSAACTPRSVEVMRALQGRVRCPRVLYADFSCQSVPCNAIVCSYLDGQSLGDCWADLDGERKRHYITQVVRELGAMFATPWQDMSCFAEEQHWAQFAWNRLERWFSEAYQRDDFPTRRLDRMRESATRWRWSLEAVAEPVLTHGDVNWGNIIVDGRDLAGLIDFDNVEIATPDIEAWRLVGAIVAHGGTDVQDAIRWIDNALPGVMYAPGAWERFALEQVYEVLWSLTQLESEGQGTREDALRDAVQDYQLLFSSDYYRAWFPHAVDWDSWSRACD